jgi:hypothetical protein
MLSISSEPLSAGQARTCHAREFSSGKQNYWSRDQQGHSEWQGKLASQWGLQGAVGSEHFARLSEGQHPQTEAQLVRHSVSKTYEGKNGREVASVEHRAGWDATFSAPKSVSVTVLVGVMPRSFPFRQFPLGERFVAREPTVRVHECPVAVLLQT